MPLPIKNKSGEQYGYIKVLSKHPKEGSTKTWYNCVCTFCTRKTVMRGDTLVPGNDNLKCGKCRNRIFGIEKSTEIYKKFINGRRRKDLKDEYNTDYKTIDRAIELYREVRKSNREHKAN